MAGRSFSCFYGLLAIKCLIILATLRDSLFVNENQNCLVYAEVRASSETDIHADDEFDYNASAEDILPQAFIFSKSESQAKKQENVQMPPNSGNTKGSVDAGKYAEAWKIWQIIKQYHIIDIVFAVFLILVVWAAYTGKNYNSDVAMAWAQENLDILRQQFAAVGFEKSLWMTRAYDQFELFCTGRRFCHYMHIFLECMPRQCFWRNQIIRRLLPGTYEGDLINIEVLLDSKLCEGMVVSLCRRVHQRDFFSTFWDLTEFTKPRSLPQGFEDFVLMSDTQEAADAIILSNKTLMRTLSTSGKYLHSIYLSDLCSNTHPNVSGTLVNALGDSGSLKSPKCVLRVCLYVPPSNMIEESRPILQLACFMIDYVASLQLSDRARESVRKLRSSYQKEKQKEQEEMRQEAIDRKRQQKKKEEDERLAKMDDAQRQRYEEQQQKKQKKCRRPKLKMVKS